MLVELHVVVLEEEGISPILKCEYSLGLQLSGLGVLNSGPY